LTQSSTAKEIPQFLIQGPGGAVYGAQGGVTPQLSHAATPEPTGESPQQIQAAYGLNQLSFSGIKGDGAGQTIALIDAYDAPDLVDSTAPNFDTSALHIFDQEFGLPDPPSFTKYNQTGQTSPLPSPSGSSGWSSEASLDVEWAHAMAPAAKIVLVEAQDDYDEGLFFAANTAVTKLGATVVSMSFGGGGGSYEDSTYFAPALASNPNAAFLASSGDDGALASRGGGIIYPSISPLVVAVGGTALTVNGTAGNYSYGGETGWSYNTDVGFPNIGSGGGIATQYSEPSWQDGVQNSGYREVTDVSAVADPFTGVSVYDPYDFGSSTPWIQIGGTSLSSPLWAGMVAVADQGRVLNGGQTLGSDALHEDLYSLAATNPQDFHDITTGYNGYNAGPGYDLVTGLGTPVGNLLLPDRTSQVQ
jgi:subtilase family serine protease